MKINREYKWRNLVWNALKVSIKNTVFILAIAGIAILLYKNGKQIKPIEDSYRVGIYEWRSYNQDYKYPIRYCKINFTLEYPLGEAVVMETTSKLTQEQKQEIIKLLKLNKRR